MSTRASIIIKSNNNERIHLYHHHDGYPDGVGQVILEVMKDWRKPYRNGWYAECIANELVKNATYHYYERERLKNYPFYGDFLKDENGNKIVGTDVDKEFEVSLGVHDDIDYLYVINCKFKTIRCYRVSYMDNKLACVKRANMAEIPEDDFTRID